MTGRLSFKITGHKDTVNIIKFYDLKLEAQGLADVAVAIGQGPSVAKGAKPSSVTLENRSDVTVKELLPLQEIDSVFDW